MTNQTRGTTTNLTKLVSWDIDFYESLDTDENCLIWLSQQEKYLLKNALRQAKWQTRWTSEQGTPQPDRDLISENMAFKLSQEYCVDLCQLINDCIETTPALQQTINNSIAGFPNEDGDPSQFNQEVFPPPVNCNKDQTWGYVDALWNYIHANNVDFLEQLNEASNQAGQINTLLSFIPAFEQIPISDILDWIANLGEYNLDAYNTSITVAIQDQIRCDLFCIAVSNNCSISFGDVYEYFENQFGGLTAPTLGATFLELVIFMITGNYPNDRIVYLWSLVQLGFAFIGAEFLGINSISPYAIQAQNGDPDNDWSLLCSECGLNGYTWDFTVDDGGFIPWVNRASYSSLGWGAGANDWHIQISSVDFDTTNIEWMEVEISIPMNQGAGEEFKFRSAKWGDPQNTYDIASTGQTIARSQTMNINCTSVALGVGNANPTPYNGFITKLTIKLSAGGSIPQQWTGGTPVQL